MSEAGGYSSGDVYVEDDENAIDQRVKGRIIGLREEVDEWEKELFTEEKFGEIDHDTAVSVWGDRVRAYLRSVEPLMWNTDLVNAEEVYLREKLGIVQITPPEEWVGATKDRRRKNGPVEILEEDELEPKARPIQGIKDVIELEAVTAEWSLQIRDPDSRSRDRRTTKTITRTQPINKRTLQNAVRTTDEWLQRNGIGVKFGVSDYESTEPL